MLTHHEAIVKDKNRFVGTLKVVESNSGSQRREHGEKSNFDVNVSQSRNTHQGHLSKSLDLFHLIPVQHDATGSLMGVPGTKMGNTK